MKKAVVVVPTYNERDSIEDLIRKILVQQGKISGFELHVLVSDSHSPDGTWRVIKKLEKENPKVHLLDVVERGIGVGLLKGHEYAIEKLKADVLLQMDGDGQHDPSAIPRFLKTIDQGYNFVIGSRFVPGGENRLELHRRIFTWGASWICRILLGLWSIGEFTNSYRAFTRQLFEKIDKGKIPWRAKSYIFQPAFLYQAIVTGAKYKEIPIVFSDRGAGYSKNKVIAYAWDILRFGLKVRREKSQTFLKFCVVGTIGFVVNALGLEFFYRLGLRPGLAAAFGAELAVISNFTLNNIWTFAKNKVREWGRVLVKFLQFNLTSFGAIVIQFIVVGLGTFIFGDWTRQIFLVLAVLAFVIPYNYFMYTHVIWRKKDEMDN